MSSVSKYSSKSSKNYTYIPQTILDTIKIQVWSIVDDHTYGFLNKAHANFFGKTIKDLSSKNVFDVFPKTIATILQNGIEDVLTTKQTFQSIETLVNSLGEKRLLSVTKTPKLNKDNLVEYIICSCEDITDKNEAEVALQKQKSSHKKIMENLLIGVIIYSSGSTILESNPVASKILGLSYEQLQGKQEIDSAWQFVNEDLSIMKLEDYPVNKVILSHKPLTEYTVGIIRPDRDYITWAITNAVPVFTETDSLDKIIVSFYEITKHKQTAIDLKVALTKFRSIYKNSPIAFQSLDINGNLLDINPKWTKTLGYNREEVIGKNFSLFLHPDSKAHFNTNFSNFIKQGHISDAQFKIRHKNNYYIFINFEGTVVYNSDKTFKQTFCVFQDVTKSKKAELALIENERELRNIFENSTNLFYSHNTEHIITYVSPQIEKMLGYTVQEAKINWTFFTSNHPVNKIGFKNTVQAIKTGKRQPPHELELVKKNGKKIWVEVRQFPLVENGKTTAIYGSLTEITEQKNSLEKLKKSEEKFRSVFESKGTAIGLFDNDGFITDCNELFVELSGHKKTEILGKLKWSTFVVKEDLDKMYAYQTQRINKTGSPPTQYECRITNKNGNLIDLLVNITIVDNTRIVSLVDITERKKTQLEIQRMQKLEDLGTIAGGIAHDFNNLLAGIFTNLEMAKMSIPKNTNSFRYIDEALNAIQNTRNLTGQLLTFAKGGSPVFRKVNTASLLKETVEFNLHGSKVKPQFNLPKNLWALNADKGQIEQVVSNLTINAKQAMPNGGTLFVKAYNIEKDEPNNSQAVLLSIKDEGIGIPPEVIKNIFHPYFTTKDFGNGLGLAVVHSIIQKHKGQISVESTPKIGTTFTIILPALKAIKQKEASKTVETNNSTNIKNSKLNVLIMDDEKMIRDIGKELLEILGHSAETAINGDDALSKYITAKKKNLPFDLVIMDLTIRGGKGGIKAIKEFLDFDPNAKVIVSSGYASGSIMANYKKHGFSGKLAKPFLVKELKNEINRVMSIKNNNS